jgi:CHAT domain
MTVKLEIRLVHSGIDRVHEVATSPPVDVIAVGHYVGVRPQASELALDQAISPAFDRDGATPVNGDEDLILTEYTERGTIRGELGQPFFLVDPRDRHTDCARQRLIVIAGMGLPGRFGTPELTVLARELCWTLGRLGRRHLATVLIGSGTGNLPPRGAADAWLRGAREAMLGSIEGQEHDLRRITFVEFSARRLREIQSGIQSARKQVATESFEIDYVELPSAQIDKLELAEREQELGRFRARVLAGESGEEPRRQDPAPTRVTLEQVGGAYRFGAITQDASLPERTLAVDKKLVEEANDELAGEWRLEMQRERGLLLERLLVPADLRPGLSSDAPLVMLVDPTTARIHWEMLAQSEPVLGTDDDGSEEPAFASDATLLSRVFVGTSRGLTRQLRTTFAPPPEAPPPPRRVLRVLVIADPAPDAPLQGAQEEGEAIATLFEQFNHLVGDETESRVEVYRLFGKDATRTAVLRHLVVRPYDVLHYAGHCVYEEGDPAKQGWLFNKAERELLNAGALNRIDRIPKFVFSNACESGITPDRSGERSAGLAPSFAESFFARGVSNFVCTAWPVNDVGARQFAVTLYTLLLGLEPKDGGTYAKQDPWSPAPMHEAVCRARRALLGTLEGTRTWGAYQHYGNPYFRLFEAHGGPHAAADPQRAYARNAPRSRRKAAAVPAPAS